MKKRVYLNEVEFETMYSELLEDETFFIDGINSLFVPSGNVSFIDKSVCQEWPNEDGEVILMTPGEAARTVLDIYLNKPKLIAAPRDFKYLDVPPPVFYTGRKFEGELFYFDLKGAYAQLYKYMSLDMRWPRGQGELLLYDVATRLWNWKSARNSVVGVSRVYNVTHVKGKQSWLKRCRNRFFNPHLWHHVQMSLHEIADIAIVAGCQYVGTDCYIFNKAKGAKYFENYLIDSQLDYRKQHGDGWLYGWHSYKVGQKETKWTKRRSKFQSNITESKGMIDWLKKQKKLMD